MNVSQRLLCETKNRMEITILCNLEWICTTVQYDSKSVTSVNYMLDLVKRLIKRHIRNKFVEKVVHPFVLIQSLIC